MNGYFCLVDWGDSSLEMPDIAVIEPALKTVKDKYGNDQRILNPWVWNYMTATAVEIEMSPLKNKNQVLKNYQKNKASYKLIRFVVTSDNHEEQLYKILNEEQPPDPNKYWIQVMKFEELNEIRPTAEVRNEKESAEAETKEADQSLSKAEQAILTYILARGFTSREEISQNCTEQGMEMAIRSVSRTLKILTDKGLLRREAKKYLPTDLAGGWERQDTL